MRVLLSIEFCSDKYKRKLKLTQQDDTWFWLEDNDGRSVSVTSDSLFKLFNDFFEDK